MEKAEKKPATCETYSVHPKFVPLKLNFAPLDFADNADKSEINGRPLILMYALSSIKTNKGVWGAFKYFSDILGNLIPLDQLEGEKDFVKAFEFHKENFPSHLVLALMGKKSKASLSGEREFMRKVADELKKIRKPAAILDFDSGSLLSYEALDALLYSLYEYNTYKATGPDDEYPKIIEFWWPRDRDFEIIEKINLVMDRVFTAADLTNLPPNAKSPEFLANQYWYSASSLGSAHYVCDLRDKELSRFGLIRAVGNSSHRKPHLFFAEYKPENAVNSKPIALIGKGVCFDTGGVSIKPSDGLEHMHCDMAGSVVAVQTFLAAMELKLPLWLVVLTPLVDNLTSGEARTPEAILKAYNGKTVRDVNTDAEGRLILADTVAYAVDEYQPALIIDWATLTGACVVALGDQRAGIFSENAKLIELAEKAGNMTNEILWHLPMDKTDLERMKDDVADLKNVGGREAGASSAAAFINEFTKGTPLLHIDIAGPTFAKKAWSFRPAKATGFGVRSGVQLLEFLKTEWDWK